MNLPMRLWRDESGAVVTAELALLGTVGVLGGVVGLNMMARAATEELGELSHAFRSLDQSYSYQGFRGCHAYASGSAYLQQDVAISLKELGTVEDAESREHRHGETCPGGCGPDCPKHGPKQGHGHEHSKDRRPMFVPGGPKAEHGTQPGPPQRGVDPRKGSPRRRPTADETDDLDEVRAVRLIGEQQT